jgi:alpha-L-rhamnosidase
MSAVTVVRPATSGRALGCGTPTPQLTWAIDGSESVDAYRVQTASDGSFQSILGDTGALPPSLPWVPWPGPPMVSREQVHWRVQVRTASGWSSWCSSTVEAGLLTEADWTAVPITPAEDSGVAAPGPAPALRTEFTLAGPVTSARLYITALGVVDATVNGRPVSQDLFAPGWSSYGTRLAYDTYDVTDLLRDGDNELAGLVGDGWYRGGLLWGERRHRRHYGDRVALLAQLEVTRAGGDRLVVSTGPEGWTATTGPVQMSDLYDGCALDQTVAPTTGSVVALDTDLRDRLFVREGPPVRRTEVVSSRSSWGSPVVHDFGQNLAGWVRLRVSGPGSVTVRHAEIVVDGRLCTSPLRSAKATDSYVVAAGEHVLEPAFTFHGFRYCEVSGDADVLSVEAVAVHSDLERTAGFSCSDPDITQLHENVVWGQRSNFLSVPTDCPQRDERLGWTGDAQVFAATACRLHDSRGFFADWLADLRADQHANGEVPVVVPDVLSTEEAGIAGWGDAACVVPWQVAVRSGDLQVLHDALPSMRRWVDWVESQLEDGLWLSDKQLGDWLDPDGPPEHPWAAKADRKLVATATFVHSARLLAQALGTCGHDGSAYAGLAARVAERAWQRWSAEAVTTQTGCALSLRFGLVPAAERASVGQALADLVAENGGRIGTGFLGTPEVLYALSDTGQTAAAYRLLTCRECPSWLYQVDRGATTTWERWDAIRPDGSVHAGQMANSDGGMLSFNHYAYGAVAAWLHDVVVGLRVVELPAAELVVAPEPGGGLTWAEAWLQTPRGRSSVRWDLEGDTLLVHAVIPPGYSARLQAPPGWVGPDGPIAAGASSWTFRRRAAQT